MRYLLLASSLVSIAIASSFLEGKQKGQPTPNTKRKPKLDIKLLQGTWSMIAGEYRGTKLSPYRKRGTSGDAFSLPRQISFAGNKLLSRTSRTQPGKMFFEFSGSVTLNAEKPPNKIDIKFTDGPAKGKTCRGIYLVVDDILILSFSPPGNPRPASFLTGLKFNQYILVFKQGIDGL